MTPPVFSAEGGQGVAAPLRVGRWYFGIHADGSVGVLAQWDGFAFVSSLSDDHDMSQYHHLHEQPVRR